MLSLGLTGAKDEEEPTEDEDFAEDEETGIEELLTSMLELEPGFELELGLKLELELELGFELELRLELRFELELEIISLEELEKSTCSVPPEQAKNKENKAIDKSSFFENITRIPHLLNNVISII